MRKRPPHLVLLRKLVAALRSQDKTYMYEEVLMEGGKYWIASISRHPELDERPPRKASRK